MLAVDAYLTSLDLSFNAIGAVGAVSVAEVRAPKSSFAPI